MVLRCSCAVAAESKREGIQDKNGMEWKPLVQSTGGGWEMEVVFHLRERGIRNIKGKILYSRSRRKEFLDGEMQGVVRGKENVGDITKGHKFHNITLLIRLIHQIRKCHSL